MTRLTKRMAAMTVLALANGVVSASPLIFDGITFPDGAVSFADQVVTYTEGDNVGNAHDNPADALGTPDFVDAATDTGYVSLGNGGQLILRFTNNSLTTSGDATADLHVFEIGGVVEAFELAISVDGASWLGLGTLSGQPTSIDIDGVTGVTPGTQYSFVRLTDPPGDAGSGFPFAEADIDAVGAIASAAPVPQGPSQVPGPNAMLLLAAALIGLGAVRYKRQG